MKGITYINSKAYRLFTYIAIAIMLTISGNALAQAAGSEWDGISWTAGDEGWRSTVINSNQVLIECHGFFDAGYGHVFNVDKKDNGSYSLSIVDRNNAGKLPEGHPISRESLNGPIAGRTYQRKNVDGHDLIIMKENGKAFTLFKKSDVTIKNEAENNVRKFLCGRYTANGKSYVFNMDGSCVWAGKEMTYSIMRDNDVPCAVIKLSDGRVMAFRVTLKGINIYSAIAGEDRYSTGSLMISLVASKSAPRWEFLSEEPFMRNYISIIEGDGPESDVATGEYLRLMRNEIFARKGYRFSSKDLNSYFSQCSWYKPAASNSQIKFSRLETLNAEVMKTREQMTQQ